MIAQNLTASDFVAVAVHRKWLLLSVLVLSSAVAFAVAQVWPKSYRSSTTILVESQKVPETYVKGVVSGTVQERLSSVRQIAQSRQLLGQIAVEVGLVPNQGTDSLAVDAVVSEMKKNVEIEISKEQSTLKLSFSHSNPAIARDVTSKIASFVVEDNLRRREQLFEGATEFLQEELKMAKVELELREKAISEFKSRYMGELPQQMEANLRSLDRLQSERTSSAETINALSSRLDSLDKSIREFKPGEAAAGALVLGPKGQVRVVDKRLEQLRDLEQRLATLSVEYKENYPDIISLKEEIRRLRSSQEASVEPQQGGDEQVAGNDRGLQAKPDTIIDPYFKDLVNQRNDVMHELSVHRQRQARIAAQIVEFEGRVDRTPAREQELVMLNRDYDNLQKNYQSLLDKRLSASISENLERRQKGEQFRIMDPAFLPHKPETPNQLLIVLCGVALGLGGGYGWAFWLEYGRGMVRAPEDAESILGFPILGTIPDLLGTLGGRESKLLRRIENKSEAQPPRESGVERATVESKGFSVPSRWVGRSHELSGDAKQDGMNMLWQELNLVAKWKPYSVASEQYRVAATKILLATADLKSTVVVVTSSVTGEGKSVSVSNLGHVLAQDLGKRTLLIDCDFKRPSLHRYFGLSASPGLMEVLSGGCPVSESLRRIEDTGLWVLTSGAKGDAMGDLAQISKIKPILIELQEQFDYIVLDAPPVLPLADMNLLASLADFLIFVVRANVTPKSAVEIAGKSLNVDGRAGVLVTGYAPINAPQYVQGYYSRR